MVMRDVYRKKAAMAKQLLVSIGLMLTLLGCSTSETVIVGEKDLAGVVFNDANGNARRDRNEVGLAGFRVFLDENDNSTLDGGERSAVTDSSGAYVFRDVPIGETYTVLQEMPFGWRNTTGGGFVTASHQVSDEQALETQVVGGGAASLEAFPFLVALQLTTGETFCTGSLITQSVVLTAAHCVVGNFDVLPASAVQIRAGSASLADAVDVLAVRRITIHENYFDAPGFDIALLELAEASDQPTVALLEPDETSLVAPLASAVVIGWGELADGAYPDLLHEANTTLVDGQACAQVGTFNDDNELCVLQTGGGVAPCFGDSGGPLLVHDVAGNWRHAGVVSRGSIPCGEEGEPDIYTSTPALLEWIVDNATETSRGYRLQVRASDDYDALNFGNLPTLEPTPAASALAQAYISNLDTGLSIFNSARLVRGGSPITFRWQIAEGVSGMVCELDVEGDGISEQRQPCAGGAFAYTFAGYDRSGSFLPTLTVSLAGQQRRRSEPVNVLALTDSVNVPDNRSEVLALSDDQAAGRYIDYYALELPSPQTLTITMTSRDFDTLLVLLDGDTFKTVESDDDSGEGLNSSLTVQLPAGRYVIGATSFAEATGRYTLRVSS